MSESTDPRTVRPRRVLALRRLLPIAACLALSACFISPPPDDEGESSFAREVVPVLLGQRAKGVDEVETIADISQLLGRDVAVRMLMTEERFVDHWADALIDILQVQRDPQGGVGVAQDDTCWGAPTRADPDPAIAEWVRDNGPSDPGAPTPAWNMTDLLRSAIALDDLSVVARAYLFPLSMRRAGSDFRTAELTDRLLRVYLNRDITCLRCHNPTFSTSNKEDAGGDIVWRRLWSIPGHPEKALFGNYYDTITATERIFPIMRGDVRDPAGGGFGIQPWGMSEDCARDTSTTAAANDAAVTHEGFQTVAGAGNPDAGFGSLDGAVDPNVSLWELEDALRQGIDDLKDGYERLPASTPFLPPDEEQFCDVVALFSTNCIFCHGPVVQNAGLDLQTDPAGALINVATQSGSSTNALRVVPSDPASSELSRRVNLAAAPGMPPGPGPGLYPFAEAAAIDDWITAGAPTTDLDNCNTSHVPDVEPDEAFAFLTASNLVDGIWQAVMGHRLTIDHGYPRNAEQAHMLWNLTELTFVPEGWSLKSVLAKILASEWFARRAPTISQTDTAYALQPILDPWIVADPTVNPSPPDHEKANGQGEQVDRYRVNSLLRSVAGTLGWEEPRRFPDGSYPSPLDEELGQFLSPALPGFSGVNFQSLLALETEIGLCEKAGRTVNSDDWIDQLVADIAVHNGANPAAPITIGEAWSILKDRLVQDPTIEHALPTGLSGVGGASTEAQALVDLMNQGTVGGLTLNSSTDALAGDLDGKLREACGILVKSPQFMLTNVTPRGYTDNDMPDPPRLPVCLPGEPCGYPDICDHWRGVLLSMGHVIACEDRSVRPSQLVLIAWPWPITLPAKQPAIAGPFTPLAPTSLDPVFAKQPRTIAAEPRATFSGMSAAKRKQATQLNGVRHRVAELCHPGLCGFVGRPAADVSRCLKTPGSKACQSIFPACDPRGSGVANCGDQPADIRDSGVLTVWAEGGQVVNSEGARYLPAGARRWVPLKPSVKLSSGDMIHVPLNAVLEIKAGGRTFGPAKSLYKRPVQGIGGHLIAITGPSAEKVLETRATKKNALTAAQLRKGFEEGAYRGRSITKKDWQRIIGYGAKPATKPVPTLKEIQRLTEDFDGQHYSKDSGLMPDGSDIPRRPVKVPQRKPAPKK